MTTILLAWIECVYKKDFELLYIGTVIIDVVAVITLAELVTAALKFLGNS